MNMFNIPRETEIEASISDEHQYHIQQVEVIFLHGRFVNVGPCDPSATYLIQGKVLSSQSKCSGRG